MVKGAREYNARMAAENQSLRKRVAIAKTSKDKKQLATLKKEAEANLADANARLKTRQKALEKTQPDFRSGYASTLPVLKQEKAKLESTIKNIAATESVISL
jgi:predicted  nucleic acid-binding Zn-ribbon protein